jgi:hypothetical protein
MKHSFTTSTPSEWLTVDIVTRILLCTPQRVLDLIQDGILNARNVHGEPRISSASVDAYSLPSGHCSAGQRQTRSSDTVLATGA